MRTIPEPDGGVPDDEPGTALIDWKDAPETVLEHVDYLLKDHGLEVVQYDTGADYHLVRIEQRI